MLGLDRAISSRPAGVSHQSFRVVPLSLRPPTTGRSADKSRPRRKPVQQGGRSCTPFGCRREEQLERFGGTGWRNFLFKKLLDTTLDYAQERVRSIPLEEALSTPVTRKGGRRGGQGKAPLFVLSEPWWCFCFGSGRWPSCAFFLDLLSSSLLPLRRAARPVRLGLSQGGRP